MSQTTGMAGDLRTKLESIHRRMADVTEEEVLAAVREPEQPRTVGATTTIQTSLVVLEHGVRTDSASTQTV